jgi:hypothetical protein
VTCYMRHMTWLFEALDLEDDPGNRRAVDAAIRAPLGLDARAHCPEVWAAVKGLGDEERAELVPRVRDALAG